MTNHFSAVCRKGRAQSQGQGLEGRKGPERRGFRLLRLGGIHTNQLIRRVPEVRLQVSMPVDSYSSLLFSPDTGTETTAVGL